LQVHPLDVVKTQKFSVLSVIRIGVLLMEAVEQESCLLAATILCNQSRDLHVTGQVVVLMKFIVPVHQRRVYG